MIEKEKSRTLGRTGGMKMIFEKRIVEKYKGMMYARCDDTESIFYYSADDFFGLKREEYPFLAAAGHTLQGYIYSYERFDPARLVIFDHGFGGGHRAYMKEIELLCRRGYRVLAYDHTGCMESGGEGANGLSQSLCDLNDCITAIKADERLAGLELSVVGHSWGAFSTMNIVALYPDISHIVALCGFVSVGEMINSFFPGPLSCYRKAIMALEHRANPRFSVFHAVETLYKSDVKALLIYSEDDRLCRRRHYDMLKAVLDDKPGVELMLVRKKGHNPNYTEKAVRYLASFTKARTRLLQKKKLTSAKKARFVASFNWEKMTAQDMAIWEKIFRHLEA